MLPVANSSAFDIWSSHSEANRVRGPLHVRGGILAPQRFVGDEANLPLKYLDLPDRLLPTDWPLLLVGPSGTGKTLIADTIASKLAAITNRPAIGLTGAEFARQLKSSIETNSAEDFRRRFVGAACLLIDPLDELSHYEAAQLELCGLLDLPTDRRVRLICTAGQHVFSASRLLPPLSSRLMSGLCLHVNPPGRDARWEILKSLSCELELRLSDDDFSFLSARLPVSAPRLRVFLAQFSRRFRNQSNSAPDKLPQSASPAIRSFLDSFVADANEKLAAVLVSRVATAFKVKVSDMKSDSRKQTTTLARAACVYLLKTMLNYSYSKIGRMFGGRDHSTMMHAYRKIDAYHRRSDSTALEFVNLLLQIRHDVSESMPICWEALN